MKKTLIPAGEWLTVAVYGLLAAMACRWARLDGGFAMMWLASAILAARLVPLSHRGSIPALAGCGVASMVATGLQGLGWRIAPELALVNLAEAWATAALVRRLGGDFARNCSVARAMAFAFGAGFVIPAAGGLIAAALAASVMAMPFGSNWLHWVVGHGCGMVTILPLAATVATRCSRREAVLVRARPGGAFVLLATLLLATGVALALLAFGRGSLWFLAGPVIFALLAAVWADPLVALAIPMVVALIGLLATAQGLGPFAHFDPIPGRGVELALLYHALVALCVLPIVAEQERRNRVMGQLARREEHYRARSEQADRLIVELRQATLTDPLTGLPNRRALLDSLQQAGDVGQKTCLAMIDIDHFKRVNDDHGHACGDEVLRHFAGIARATLRRQDLLARVGGEEFAVLLTDSRLDQAEQICQRLVDRLATTPFLTESGPIVVTISSGVTAIDWGAEDAIDIAFRAADKALYRAKREGRSRLRVAA